MKRLLKILGIGVAVLVILIAGFVVRTLWLAGVFTKVESHFTGTCQLVRGLVGSEDLTIQARTGIAYISTCDRRTRDSGKPKPGAIYALDLKVPGATPINLTPKAGGDFQPHGLSLWTGEDGRATLFVINHPPGAPHSVEVFDLVDGGLVHRTSLSNPLLVMPNDLVAVDHERFYLTNTHANPPGTRQNIETFLRLPGARVLFYDGHNFRVALENVVMPNGINLSPDGRTLYIASVTTHRVKVFDRDPSNERLQLRSEIYLGSGPDNIEVDPSGTLWVAAHAKLLQIGKHARDPKELSPSQVFRITPDGEVTEFFADSGEQISGASVGALFGKHLVIGQIFDDGVLDCVLP